MELERALTKLKFDETVSGYALITNDGAPFLSFKLPEDVFPQVAATLRTYSSSLKLMNVMTGSGMMVLARVDANWVLAVLFNVPQLGIALQKTKEVVNILEGVVLPPPPKAEIVEPTAFSPVISPKTLEAETTQPRSAPSATIEAPTPSSAEFDDIPLESVDIKSGCVVLCGPRYDESTKMDSVLSKELKEQGSTLATDALLMVDGKRTVFKISQELARPVEDVMKALKPCVSKRAVRLECPAEQVTASKEITDFPLFEGDVDKTKKEHRAILEMCDGSVTLQTIANQLGIPYFQALQSILPYKGKSLKMVRKDKGAS